VVLASKPLNVWLRARVAAEKTSVPGAKAVLEISMA